MPCEICDWHFIKLRNVVLLLKCQMHDDENEFGHLNEYKKACFAKQYLELFSVLIMQVKQEFLLGICCIKLIVRCLPT